ncbi:MAG TPA: sugar transferase [Terracidiphilus sp.]|jgi:exopolysaccharide biosynthesis polyprenyl glycosylphosphotransferase|nr:sugar transferase [Terracidiphilus sp.]
MATSEFWQRVSAPTPSSSEWVMDGAAMPSRQSEGKVKFWMFLDFLTVVVSATIATIFGRQVTPVAGARYLYHGTLFYGRPVWVLLALVFGFALALIVSSKRLNLYNPARLGSFLHEQRLTVEVCFTSGLLLTGTLYLLRAEDISRRIVMFTLFLVTASLCTRRFVYRTMMYRKYESGQETRNVLIVGTGPEAHALRHHLESIRNLGYTFKGFIESPGAASRIMSSSGDVVGNLDTLFDHARQQFVDEILFTMPCERRVVLEALEKARMHGVDLRVVPDLYEGLAWDNPIEYIGQFPTIPLHRGHVPELGFVLKRVLDVFFGSLVLLIFSPFLLLIGIAIKLESRGPIFYRSQRIGKKGRVFRCYKFRTMVRDAEKRRSEVMHMNERDGVLFKVTNDPRITRLGRFLRKYSLDELPQFINVLKGDMSVVGPRPPIASEVMEYKLNHLRRLDVTPGITGLWQVQARQDPSFDSYVSLDVAYIENWSVWLDFKIILRTIGVVFSGTGS